MKHFSFPNRIIFLGDRPRRVERSNLYAHQNRKNFTVTNEGLKAFLGINFVMEINKLPMITEYWRVGNLISNDSNQNTMIRNLSCEILQNLHFADIRKDDKTGKNFKMRPVIDNLNSKFSEVLTNDNEQSIDKHMVKFKGRSGMQQNITSIPIKWVFKLCFCYWSKSGYLYQMDVYLRRKKTSECNLGGGEEVGLLLRKDLERLF